MHGSGPYGIPLFDALHTYLPALLYDNRRFTTVQSVLGYIRSQARHHLDIFSREQRAYRSTPGPTLVGPTNTEPVVDALLRGLFTQPGTQPPITVDITAATNIFDLLNAPGFMNPVPVRPTEQQINAGSELLAVDSGADGAICSICQDSLRGQLRRLRHCNHTFHRACIDTWFTSHVQCPECRHDIREP